MNRKEFARRVAGGTEVAFVSVALLISAVVGFLSGSTLVGICTILIIVLIDGWVTDVCYAMYFSMKDREE